MGVRECSGRAAKRDVPRRVSSRTSFRCAPAAPVTSGKRVVVLTSVPRAARHGEEFYSGDLASLAEALSGAGARRVYVDGGTVLTQFLSLGMLDDLTVSIVPILPGDGVRLTQNLRRDVRLDLVESRSFASGLVQLEYRAAGKPAA